MSEEHRVEMNGAGQTPPPAGSAAPAKPPVWRSAWRWPVSALLLFHLASVFIPPLRFATENSSPFVRMIHVPFEKYGDLLYLQNGYAFFSPDPGPSHLIRYRVEFDDGRQPIERTFPDLDEQQPRLLYHRYFMLAEHYNAAFVPPEPPPEPPRPPRDVPLIERKLWQLDHDAWELALADWKRQRPLYEKRQASMQSHILAREGGDRAVILRMQHEQPTADAYNAGLGIDTGERRLFYPIDPDPAQTGAAP